MSEDQQIDLYRVGILAALANDWGALTKCGRLPGHTVEEIKRLGRNLRARKWRAAKNQFNGWLAEHRTAGTRCGHAWSKQRALADLHRHLATLPPIMPNEDECRFDGKCGLKSCAYHQRCIVIGLHERLE